jgi:hypothetical protein
MRVIRASELGEYSYCSRAWWYRHVLKIAPPGAESASRLEAGIEAHARHGRAVALSSALRTASIALALLGLLALVLALVGR